MTLVCYVATKDRTYVLRHIVETEIVIIVNVDRDCSEEVNIA